MDQYMTEYAARGLTAGTVERVRSELERWGNWLKRRRRRVQLEDVGTELIVRYIQGRTAFRSKSTVSSAMSVLRGMGDFLVREGYWTSNPLRWMRGPKRDWRCHLPRRISRGRLRRLWESAGTDRKGYHRSLWLAVLGLLYGTGLRRGELERLDVSDWHGEEGTVRCDGRKTGRPREVAVPELSWRCVEAYLVARHNHLERLGMLEEKALLVSKLGGRLTGTAISCGIRRLTERAGVGKITLHQFRHTCASDLIADGIRLPEVQRILGHATIDTTMRYLQVADPERHEAVRRHPINEILSSGGAS
jgi:integrase/recombinase XerD